MKRSEPRPDPDQATDEPAGSPEKIRAMRRRHSAGRAIHHPGDNPVKVTQRRDPQPPPGVFE